MNLELKGRSVLVTGGSKGIGLACAKAFAAEGCRVHIASRSKETLDRAAQAIGGETRVHAVDLRDGIALRTLWRAPASPPKARASARSASFRRIVRWADGVTSVGRRSLNVSAGQADSKQRKRRT